MNYNFKGTIKEYFEHCALFNNLDEIDWSTIRISGWLKTAMNLGLLDFPCEFILPEGIDKITVWGKAHVYFTDYDDGPWYVNSAPRNPENYDQ